MFWIRVFEFPFTLANGFTHLYLFVQGEFFKVTGSDLFARLACTSCWLIPCEYHGQDETQGDGERTMMSWIGNHDVIIWSAALSIRADLIR